MNADNEEPTLTKGAEKVGGVIPEIFFDVIARVIPGSVFLLAYCLTYRLPVSPILDPDAVRPIEFLTVFLYIAPFFVAYSIGLFAHLTSRLIFFGLFFPVLWLRFKFCDNNRSEYKEANNKKTKKYKEYVDKSWYVRSRDLLDRFEKLSPSKHNLLKKIMAESGFFRSSVLLCLLLSTTRRASSRRRWL